MSRTKIAAQDTKAGIHEQATDATLARLGTDAETARARGFAVAPPVRAIGSPLNATGQENIGASRLRFEKLPPAEKALGELVTLVRAEGRRDETAYPSDLSMLSGGALATARGILGIEEPAFGALCARVTPGGANYLAQCPSGLRSANINTWMRTLAEGENNPFLLRTRKTLALPKGEAKAAEGDEAPHRQARSIFGVVSEKYSRMDVDEVAEALAENLEPGARADVKYDGYSVRIDVEHHTDIKPNEAAAGEIFKSGIRLRTADDGSSAIQCEAFVIRNLCVNLIILDRAKVQTLSKRHVGRDLQLIVRAGLEQAKAAVKDFGKAWGEAERDRLIDEGNAARPAEVFNRLIEAGLVKIPGCRADELSKRLLQAWQMEPGFTRRSIVNAVTRAAHTNRWVNPWAQESLEQQGGQLLYCRTLARTLSDN